MLKTALDAHVSPETLRKIETGRVATPAFPTIAAIADVLGLSLDAVWAEIRCVGGVDQGENLGAALNRCPLASTSREAPN